MIAGHRYDPVTSRRLGHFDHIVQVDGDQQAVDEVVPVLPLAEHTEKEIYFGRRPDLHGNFRDLSY
jgi:hypothetical protein